MSKYKNKLIKDKLESLDFLPLGYQPNLNSKWALIEEAIGERVSAKAKRIHLWTGIAACLLVLTYSIGLWLYLQRTIVLTVIPSNHLKPQLITSAPSADSSQFLHKRAVRMYTPNHLIVKDIAVRKTIFDGPLPVDQPVTKLIDNKSKINPTVDRVTVSSKSTKQRYVQIDFDDESASLKVNKPAVFAQTFRLKLGIINSQSNTDNSIGNSTGIKFRQNF